MGISFTPSFTLHGLERQVHLLVEKSSLFNFIIHIFKGSFYIVKNAFMKLISGMTVFY